MADVKNKSEVSLQVQRNLSAPYIANNLALNSDLQLKTVDKINNSSVFEVSGISQKKLVSDGSESGESEFDDTESDVISDLIGHIGKWQLFWAFILCLFQFPSTFHIFSLVFQAAGKDFWCERPSHLQSIPVDVWRKLTQPDSKDSCNIYNIPFSSLSAFNFTSVLETANNTAFGLVKCTSWEFDMSLIGKTIISEWNIVCERHYLESVVESCFLAGAGLGSVSSGWISDRYGRRNTLMIFASIQFIVGFLIGFCQSLELYMFLRLVIGFCSMAVVVVSFVLCVELVSGKWRRIIGILNILPVAIAYIICAGISYATYNWRTMQFVISSPVLVLLCLWYFIPESPRWLLANGKAEELAKLIDQASKWNHRSLPSNYRKTLNISPSIVERKVSVFDLFQKDYKFTTLLMFVIWFSIILIYFGITLHMSSLGGNVYINTVIAGSVEAFSIVFSIFVVLKLGLRVNLFIYMIIAGIACVLINFARADYLWLTISLAMIVKISIGACNALIPTYTAEQYPVYMRNLSIGSGNLAAGFALVLVPYLFFLGKINVHLPMSLMGLCGMVGGFSLLLIKEKTSGSKMGTNLSAQAQVNNGFISE